MRADQPSSTALLIARCLLLAAATPTLRPWVPDASLHLTRRFLEAAPPSPFLGFALGRAWTRRLLFACERVALPGIILHYLLRKRLIEEHARAFLSQTPHGQLVVLGAGLDTLAWRLHAEHACAAFELDHPATQRLKHAAKLACAPTLLPADFTNDSPEEVLKNTPAYDAQKPALFVAEGLLMYFSPERVTALLDALHRSAAPDSRLIFTFMESTPGRPLGFRGGHRLVNAWLRHRREPFLWGTSHAELPAFLERHGWRLEHLSSHAELRARFLNDSACSTLPLAEGESIALARRL